MKLLSDMKVVQTFRRARHRWVEAKSIGIISELLSQAEPNSSLSERMMWLALIIRWVRKDEGSHQTAARLRYLFQVLDKNPQWQIATSEILVSVFVEASFLRFLVQTDAAVEHGLWHEVLDRFLARIFPRMMERDFYECVVRAFNSDQDELWIHALPEDVILRIENLLSLKETDPWRGVRKSIADAMLLLTTNMAHIGLTREIRRRLDLTSIRDSPFMKMQIFTQQLIDGGGGNSALGTSSDLDLLGEQTGHCRSDIQRVYQSMETTGVSVALVYRLETILASLDQVETLMKLYQAMNPHERRLWAKNLFAKTVGACVAKRRVRDYVSRHLNLLARKIAERNGFSGEHYISHSWREYLQLFRSGVGCGVVVAFMTIVKINFVQMTPAPLFRALGIWLIYAVSFLTMQFCGYTLATKLPSFTASHLARKLREIKQADQVQAFKLEVRDIFRSQSAALLGNIAGLIPITMVLAWLLQHSVGGTGVEPEHALHVIESLNPLFSWSIALGALTGLQLWVSSLCGGWFENWIVFNGLIEALAEHPQLKAILGAENARSGAQWLLRNSSGIATNIALGFLFGFVPLFGMFFAVPLDGKHVTISSAETLFSFLALSPSQLTPALRLGAFAGLFTVGVMNLIVSFSLALFVAARACNVTRSRFLFVLVTALRRRPPRLPSPIGQP
jgi:site-specific recombinase